MKSRSAGVDHVIVENGASFAQDILGLTGGQGVHVVFDGSGAVTFDDSLASLRRHRVMAYCGPRSILIGYPIFSDHIATRDELLARARQLFDWIKNGEIQVKIGKRYPLSETAQAHADIESRRSIGKLLLIP